MTPIAITPRVRLTPEQLELAEAILPEQTVRRITISGVNDATKFGQTRVNRLIRDTLTLPKAATDDAITRRTTRDDDGAFGQELSVSQKKIGLGKYKPRQTKTGLSARMVKGQKRETIRHAFLVAKFGNGAFVRFGPKRKNSKGQMRQAVRELRGPTAYGALARRDPDVNVIRDDMADKVLERVDSKLQYELEKAANKP